MLGLGAAVSAESLKRLAALLLCVIPLLAGLFAIGLRLRLTGIGRSGERNGKSKSQHQGSELLHDFLRRKQLTGRIIRRPGLA